jgi:competence protein ComEC
VQLFPYQWWHGENLLSLALMSGGLFLILLPRAWQLKGLALVWLLLAFIPLNTQPKPPLRVTIFDVGQGLAVLLQTQHHTLLYDTGPSYYGGGDAATSAVLPFLKRQTEATIDVMVVSHQDADHSGGVPTLLKQLPVTSLITSTSQSPFVKKIYTDSVFRSTVLFDPRLALHLGQCVQGQQWRWDGVDFRFLSPEVGATDQKGNNLSCVLVVTVAGHRLLLTGDIEARVEARLLLSAKDYLSADVLLAPHHGSITSSSSAFVAAVKPKIVVFSTGYLNRYHFPAKNVQKRYQMEGVLAYNTADNGAVSLSFNDLGEMSPISTVRQEVTWQAFLEKWYMLTAVDSVG